MEKIDRSGKGRDISFFQKAVQKSAGELIFWRIPHQSMQVALLGREPKLMEVGDSMDFGTGKSLEVPIIKGVEYPFLDLAEFDREIKQIQGIMKIQMPFSHGIKIVADGYLPKVRQRIEKSDWILAAGNSAVTASALALADVEIKEEQNFTGVQNSHGLLLLSAIKEIGLDWESQLSKTLYINQFIKRIEGAIIELGIIPFIAHQLGWDILGDLKDERFSRRLKAFNFPLSEVRERVTSKLSQINDSKAKIKQRYSASFYRGDFNKYINASVDNILENYLGILS